MWKSRKPKKIGKDPEESHWGEKTIFMCMVHLHIAGEEYKC